MKRKPWALKAWREKRRIFLVGKVCEWCGTSENLVIHHPSYLHEDGSSISDEEYLDFEASGAIALCNRCHLATLRGYVLCPRCKKNYRRPQYEVCFPCAVKERPELNRHELLEYVHPWCGRRVLIERQYWEFEAEPRMCCVERCGKMGECEAALKRWDEDLEGHPEEATPGPP